MAEKEQETAPEWLDSPQWQTLKAHLMENGRPLDQLLPIHCGDETFNPAAIACAHCQASIPVAAFAAVVNFPRGVPGPLEVVAVGNCPKCEYGLIHQVMLGEALETNLKPLAAPTQARRSLPRMLDLVALCRLKVKADGESDTDLGLPLNARLRRRLRSRSAWVDLIGFVILALMIHSLISGLPSFDYDGALSTLLRAMRYCGFWLSYEVFVIWISGKRPDRKQN